MPKKKTPEEKPEDQFKRFVETAEKIGVNKKEAEETFKRLTVKKPSKSP
jgi:DNA-binding transcriptional regulator YhcF (GntR family)